MVADADANHPKGDPHAYADIRRVLDDYGLARVQGSVYLADRDDLANLFSAILAWKALPWFPASVRDLRAFKVEHWFDFTSLVKA